MEALFEQFAGQLAALGYRARKGQLVDATLVPVPVQHNTLEESSSAECLKRVSVWNGSNWEFEHDGPCGSYLDGSDEVIAR